VLPLELLVVSPCLEQNSPALNAAAVVAVVVPGAVVATVVVATLAVVPGAVVGTVVADGTGVVRDGGFGLLLEPQAPKAIAAAHSQINGRSLNTLHHPFA
jgi:hypothetical protein